MTDQSYLDKLRKLLNEGEEEDNLSLHGGDVFNFGSGGSIPPDLLEWWWRCRAQVQGNELVSVLGGSENEASGTYAVIGGGHGNETSGVCPAVLGGDRNKANSWHAVVGGGFFNEVTGAYSGILGGNNNYISNWFSVIGGGWNNEVSGECSGILGGEYVEVSGDYAFGAGRYLELTGDHAFIFGYATSTVTFSQDDAFITYGLRPFMSAPNSAPTDSDLKNGQVSFWLDETSNDLVFRVKYSDGTLKTGRVALT